MATSPAFKSTDFNPFDPEFLNDPYPTYARIRQDSPIQKTIFDTWIITSFDLAETILKDTRFKVDNLPERLAQQSLRYNDSAFANLATMIDKWITFVNPPDHARLKRAVSPLFTQQSINALRPFIFKAVNTMLEGVSHGSSIDVIVDLATPLASMSIATLIGLPEEDASKLFGWCEDTVFIFDQPASLGTYKHQAQVMAEFTQYLNLQVQLVRQNPNQGLLSFLIEQQSAPGGLSDDEIVSSLILLAATGQESTKGLIGNGILALLTHPECLRQLTEHPHHLENAVEELLRFDSPIQYISRRASEDVLIGERLVRAGEYVVIYLGAVNRDPVAFADPDQLNFNRRTKNLGFGSGLHYCVGSYLAKLEMEIVVSSLLPLLSKYHVEIGSVERSRCRISRRLSSLPLTFISATE
jgi:hypothetical protein